MSRALAYCAFRNSSEISLPQAGVASAPVQVMAAGEMRLLWSEVAWPFAPEKVRKNAVEFHEVVSHVFKQAAVIPFRLLSVFEDERALAGFAGEHSEVFLADLERLKDCVQMECVVYPSPARMQARSSSGVEYLREKAGMLRAQEQHISAIKGSLGKLARAVRTREGKNGTRVFVLTERGSEKELRSLIEQVGVPELLSRRISGPWPAAEFLSDQVRAPQSAEAK